MILKKQNCIHSSYEIVTWNQPKWSNQLIILYYQLNWTEYIRTISKLNWIITTVNETMIRNNDKREVRVDHPRRCCTTHTNTHTLTRTQSAGSARPHTPQVGGRKGEKPRNRLSLNSEQIYIKIDAHYITIDGFAKYIYCVCAWKTLSATSKRVRLFY